LKRQANTVGDQIGGEVGGAQSVLNSGGKRRCADGRGAGSRKRHKRAGNSARKLERLAENLQKKGETLKSSEFSIVKDGSVTSTGWHGSWPTLNDRKLIDEAYASGRIKAMIAKFYPVQYKA
jgi:hypothetical protein